MTPISSFPLSCTFIVPSHSDTGLGHVTFFGPQDAGRCAAGVSLKSVYAFLPASLLLCRATSMTRPAAGGTWERCGGKCSFSTDWPVDQIDEWAQPRSAKPAPIGRNTQSTHRLWEATNDVFWATKFGDGLLHATVSWYTFQIYGTPLGKGICRSLTGGIIRISASSYSKINAIIFLE